MVTGVINSSEEGPCLTSLLRQCEASSSDQSPRPRRPWQQIVLEVFLVPPISDEDSALHQMQLQ